jgi:hypothetical protein
MDIKSRVERLEAKTPRESGDEFARRFNEAWRELAGTMDAADRAEVRTALSEHIEAGAGLDYDGLTFLAARVYSLLVRAANGLPVALVMPLALASAWKEHDARTAGESGEQRFRASFNFQACAACGAEHPWRGRYALDAASGFNVVANPGELIKTCLACGGPVGGVGARRSDAGGVAA